MKKTEQTIHNQICQYLDLQYPMLVYTSDLSGVKLTIGQAVQAKKQRCKKFKIPDLLILQANDKYCGLILELKKDKSEVFGKKNQLLKNAHVEAQIQALYQLCGVGYFASFAFGFEGARAIIDAYLHNKQPYLIIDKL